MDPIALDQFAVPVHIWWYEDKNIKGPDFTLKLQEVLFYKRIDGHGSWLMVEHISQAWGFRFIFCLSTSNICTYFHKCMDLKPSFVLMSGVSQESFSSHLYKDTPRTKFHIFKKTRNVIWIVDVLSRNKLPSSYTQRLQIYSKRFSNGFSICISRMMDLIVCIPSLQQSNFNLFKDFTGIQEVLVSSSSSHKQ